MTELRQKMQMELELRGYSPRTIYNYLTNVAAFAQFYNKSPELLGEDEIRKYLHYCITEKKVLEATVNNIYSAIKFLYTKVLDRPWNMDKVARMKQGRRLPAILSQSEVKDLFDVTTNLKHKAILMTIYSAGLRVSEAAKLRVVDIDSKNMQIIVNQGKGKKDRFTLLSESNLKILREYWLRYQPKDFLFPGQKAGSPLSTRTIEKIFDKAADKAGIKKAVSVHTLRRCFATHLLDVDTNLFKIQRLMGHRCISSTTRYLFLSRQDTLSVKSPLEYIMDDEGDK